MAEKQGSTVADWIAGGGMHPRDSDFVLPDDMVAQIDGASVIILGEFNHFIHEKADFRLWWIDQLSSRWPVRIGEELGRSDALLINRYLASGDESCLARVPTFGYKGDDRQDRSDQPDGILKGSYENYPTDRFRAEQIRFYKGIRALKRDIGLFGFDINGSLGAGYRDIEEHLSEQTGSLAGSEELQAFRNSLQMVPGESISQEISRLKGVLDGLAHRGVGVSGTILKDLQVMVQTLEFAAGAYPAKDYAALNPSMAAREQLMKQQVGWQLADLGPSEKLVLMGHALHLVRDDGATGAQEGATPGGNRFSTLGHHVVQELGTPTFAVWLVYGSGEDSQPFPDLPRIAQYPASTLNAMLLAQYGEETLLSTAHAALMKEQVTVGHMYNNLVEVNLARQTDLIHFIPRVSPLRT